MTSSKGVSLGITAPTKAALGVVQRRLPKDEAKEQEEGGVERTRKRGRVIWGKTGRNLLGVGWGEGMNWGGDHILTSRPVTNVFILGQGQRSMFLT